MTANWSKRKGIIEEKGKKRTLFGLQHHKMVAGRGKRKGMRAKGPTVAYRKVPRGEEFERKGKSWSRESGEEDMEAERRVNKKSNCFGEGNQMK